MLISSVEELRLYAPANAIDHIETLAGFLDSSEHDFLAEKLGHPLHASLTEYYQNLLNSEDGLADYIQSITNGIEMPPYARLLTVAQRIVAFDALGRAIDMQAISVNGAGINISTADDYAKADHEAVAAYKSTCIKEAHAAVNRLLVLLEGWTKDAVPEDTDLVSDGSPSGSEEEEEENTSEQEKSEIARLWRASRFFYLAAGLVIPSAIVLQDYLNIYESREKFITLLPELRTIQEDIMAPIIGEDFMDYLIAFSRDPKPSSEAPVQEGDSHGLSEADVRLLSRILHRLRKAVARHLESRTMQMKLTDPRRNAAHDEAVQLTTDLADYITAHQSDLPTDALTAFTTSPLYKPTDVTTEEEVPSFENNAPDSVIFVTPALS
jgi:hypothetical protein